MNTPERTGVTDFPSSKPRNRVHCSAHCRACGSHFSNTGAFDAHRVFEEGHKDDWDHRICLEPGDSDRFAPKSTDGLCDNDDITAPQLGVTVWTLAAYLETKNPWAA